MARRPDSGSGNGDRCPVDPDHGNMFVLQPGTKQYCGHQSHDGRTKQHPEGVAPPTRKMWPTGHNSFAASVAEYHGATTKAAVEPSALPTLDITLEV